MTGEAPDLGEGGTSGAEADTFATALRVAITRRGLTLERIRHHLRQRGHELSVATLSYWQSGRSRPDRASSLAALGSLEEILDVPRGSLVVQLPRQMRNPGPAGSAIPSVGPVFDTGMLIDEAVETLGINWEHLERVSVHDFIRVLPDRSVGTHLIRETMRATVSGVDRFVVVYGDEPIGTPYVMPRWNCRLGRTIEHPRVGLVIAEMLLDQPMAVGDPVLVEYEFANTGAIVADAWERGCLNPQREVLIEVEFTEPVVPRAARARIVTGPVDRSEPALVSGNFVSLLRQDAGPGMVALYWSW